MKKLWAWLKKTVHEMATDDPTSWVSHWTLVGATTIIPAGIVTAASGEVVGVLVANILAEIWAYFFVGREVANYIHHKAQGDDMQRFTLDGFMDLVGPLAWRVLWWIWLVYLLLGG
jgi:hypothetical protein